jgi:hypothetical protein
MVLASRPTYGTRPLLMARHMMPTQQSEVSLKTPQLPSIARARQLRRK